MLRNLAALLALPVPGLLTFDLAAQRPASPDHHLVRVEVRTTQHLLRLQRLDLDLASCHHPELGGKQVEVIASDADLRILAKAGFVHRVVQRNLEDHYEAELRKHSLGQPDTLTPPLGQGAMGGHYTLAQIEAILDSFHAKFPALCSKKASIGKTIEGRDIWMVKISDNVLVDENEPEVFYDALHHAREPLSMEATLLFMDELLDGYGTDPEATLLIDERELFFVPCLNPDGYEYNRSIRPNGGGMWRKNRRDNGDGSWGVDLNRNYPTGWSAPNGGNSTRTSSDTYRGAAPFSEPETLAVDNFIKSRRFVQINSCHTYTEVLLQPWGYQNGTPANNAAYQILTRQLLAKNPMRAGPASTELYIAAGTALDHHHAAHGAFAWTPELGTSAEGGFWPAGQNIITVARRHQPMFRAIALSSGPLLEVVKIDVTEVSGNQNGIVEPGETGGIVVQLRNDGAASTAGAATAVLSKVPNGVRVVNGITSFGVVAGFATPSPAAALTFQVPSSWQGAILDLGVTLRGDGRGAETPVQVLLAPLRIAVQDDMEVDRGLSRATGGTATTGLWERSTPQATNYNNQIIQPGTQHTPGGSFCWVTDGRAGNSVGQHDVDGGYTDLLTPVLDLDHLQFARVELQRWYAESAGDDAFVISVSRDGGQNWTDLLSSTASTAGWVPFAADLPGPLTSTMRLRFRAQDLRGSLVEAAIDDLAIRGITADGNLTVLSSGRIGSTLQLGINGEAGAVANVLLGIRRAPGSGIAIPGIAGALALDPAAAWNLGGVTVGAGGFRAEEYPIPKVSGLSGLTLLWQLLYVEGSAARFGNLQATAIR